MLQIRIDQQHAKIGLDIKKPVVSLKTVQPKIEMNIKKPELEIHSPRPKIYIDQTECFADAGRRTPAAFIEHYAGIARSAALEAIGNIASDGDMLARIENGVTLEDLAAQAMDNMAEFDVAAIPKQPPKIEADVKPVEITFHRGTVDLEIRRGRVENYTELGRVDVYIRQKNYLNITWQESKINKLA